MLVFHPYALRFKNFFMINVCAQENQYRGSSEGFLHIEGKNFKNLAWEFIQAGKELGYDEIDVNGPQRSGKF